METVIIHGQNHKGSTYHIASNLALKVGGNIKEFFCRKISVSFVPVVQSVF